MSIWQINEPIPDIYKCICEQRSFGLFKISEMLMSVWQINEPIPDIYVFVYLNTDLIEIPNIVMDFQQFRYFCLFVCSR